MEFLKSCDQMAAGVADAIHDLIGTKEGDKMIRMGADGTPTKLIDQVAEDCIVGYLAEHPLVQDPDQRRTGKT